MSEYIVRETGYPGAVKQEVIGELVRCKGCKHHHKITCAFLIANCMKTSDDEDFCSRGERKDDATND